MIYKIKIKSGLVLFGLVCILHYSLRFNGHFPGGPTWVSRYRNVSLWILLELRVTEVVVTTGAIRRAKLQSNHHHQQTNA